MIAGAGAEGCFLIPFTLSMEIVGVKVTNVKEKNWKNWIIAGSTSLFQKNNPFQFFLTISRSVSIFKKKPVKQAKL